MRVCFLVGAFPSLSETFVLGQITGLMDRGHDVRVLAGACSGEGVVHPEILRRGLLSRVCYYQDKPKNSLWRILVFLAYLPGVWLAAPGVVLKALDVKRYGKEALSLNLFFKARAFLSARDCDVVVAHFGVNGLEGALMRDLGAMKCPMVVFFHAIDLSVYPRRYGRDVYRHLFESTRCVLPISVYAKTKLLELGCPEHKIKIHPMGVALPVLKDHSRGPLFHLLSVARLVDKKGIVYALEAVAQLKAWGVPLVYTVIGDGPLMASLKSRLCDLGLEGCVTLTGWQDASGVAQHLLSADVLVAPSILADNGDEEGVPVVLMEAMAQGVCVVSTPTGGIAELVSHGKTGVLVPPQDAAALAVALKMLWDDPCKAAVLARQGRAVVEQRHDILRLNDALEVFLQELAHDQ
ncbi:MAG: glycosyltransferase [Candidatus Omnitrophota bacterium]